MEDTAGKTVSGEMEDSDPDFIRYLFDPNTKFTCYFVVGDPALGPTEKIGACKLKVLAHSKVFRRMLEESELAEKDPVEIPDIQPSTFKYMLRLMIGYNIIPKLTMEEAVDLLYAVEKYMVDALKESLAIHIASLLTMDNVFIPLKRPECFQQKTLKNVINKKVQFNTKVLLSHQDFLELNRFGLMHILEQDALSVPEIELWQAALKWAKHQAQSECGSVLRELLSEHLKYIRFCTLPLEVFVKEVVLTNILTHQEVSLINQTFGSQNKQEDLTTVCNTIETRILVCDIIESSVLTTNWKSVSQQYSNKQSHIYILTKKLPLLLVSVLCMANKHSWTLVPTGLKYKCQCRVTVTRITDFDKDTSTEPPVEFDFSENIEYGKYFWIPFQIKGGNIKLSANNKYKVVLTFTADHFGVTNANSYNQLLDISDINLTLSAGIFYIYQNCNYCGSHILQLNYKTLTKV